MKKITQNINKDKLFNDLPKVSPQMSKWKTKSANYQSCNLGDIVPIYYDEVLPGEKRKITMGMISHTVTPVAPIFNSMYTEIRSFVVPIRLCADLLNGYKTRKSPWVKVFGEDNASTSADIVVPLAQQTLPTFSSSHNFIVDVADYLDNISTTNNIFNSLDLDDPDYDVGGLEKYNFLQLAAYELIYQRHYRNENYESATASSLYRHLFDAYNVSKASESFSYSFTFEKANREKDYFTGMKPFTQKGDPVRVSFGTSVPITTSTKMNNVGTASILFGYENGTSYDVHTGNLGTNTTGAVAVDTTATFSGNKAIKYTNLIADLTSVPGISIEELRLLIKTQELLEKDAMYGSLYAESLNAHFGTCPLDLTLQDPQEIYKTIVSSNMQAIFQTSSTSGESSILGSIGANSTTQTDPFVILPETEFKEHCILMICAVHKLQNVYDAKWFKPKFATKHSRFDFYTPELNDLGYQPVTSSEMRSSSNAVAGFNEAFAEYRFKFNKVHGELASTFPYWAPAIADDYSSASTLYKEDPTILDQALSVASTSAPQFYDAWGFEETNTKPMSLHSIPGMDGVI